MTASARPLWPWVLMLLVCLASSSRGGPDPSGFVTGFNQAWWRDAYGRGWIQGYDHDEAVRLIYATRSNAGRVLRVWLFEGLSPEGIFWDEGAADTAGPAVRVRPTGIDSRKLHNIERFLQACRAQGIRVYITLLDGNMYRFEAPHLNSRQTEWKAVLDVDSPSGRGFRASVLAPLGALLGRYQDSVYGVDLCNEVNALVRAGWFRDGWKGARSWMDTWRNVLRSTAPVPVTASFGHHDALSTLFLGRLPSASVDFHDIHAYDDEGKIPYASALRLYMMKATRPVILGEFGQSSGTFDDARQCLVTQGFIRHARSCGLSGAFAWRLSDVRPGHNPEARFSYEAFGAWRPAMATFRRVSQE